MSSLSPLSSRNISPNGCATKDRNISISNCELRLQIVSERKENRRLKDENERLKNELDVATLRVRDTDVKLGNSHKEISETEDLNQKEKSCETTASDNSCELQHCKTLSDAKRDLSNAQIVYVQQKERHSYVEEQKNQQIKNLFISLEFSKAEMEELTNRLQLEKAIMLALFDVYFNFFNRLSLLVVGLNKTNVEDMRRRVSVYIAGCDDKLEREKPQSPYRYTKQNTSIHSPKLSSAYKSRLVSPKRVRQFQTDVLREESIGIYYTHQHITSREGSDITEEYMKCKRRCQELEAINESNTAEIALFREKNQNLLDLLKESSACRPNGNSYIHEGNQQTQSICASLSNEIRRLTEENTQYEVIINKLQRKLCESNHVSAIQAEHRIEIMKWKNFVSELEADVIEAEYAAERSQAQLRLLSRQLKDIGAR